MLQELALGRLENEWRDLAPAPGDRVLCVRDRGILVKEGENASLTLPTYDQVRRWAENWEPGETVYGFRLCGENWFLYLGDAGDCPDGDYSYRPARNFRQFTAKTACYGAMTGWHLYQWYRGSRFCGRCGERTVHDDRERMRLCPRCGSMTYPRISPAVIVGVTDGDRILLSKYAGRGHTNYALIAGYTEIGETVEQTVAREVMEEVGLKVKNLRYYKSQPWGIDGNVLMGFYCDLDGSDAIRLDEQELALAQWHRRDALPIEDDGISLTREMIRIFGEGKEPQ